MGLGPACGGGGSSLKDVEGDAHDFGGIDGDAAAPGSTTEDGDASPEDETERQDAEPSGDAGSMLADASAVTDGGDREDSGETPKVPTDYTTLHRSGSRLAVQVLRVAGAPERFERFYDRQLDVPCRAGKLADGRWHCVPIAAEGLSFLGYADARCELPVYEAGEGCARAPTYVPQAVNGCTTSFQVHVIAPANQAGPLFVRTNGTCGASGSTYPAAKSLVATGLAAPQDFVELTRKPAPTAGKLTVMLEMGADGSQAATQLVDAASGVVCDVVPSPVPSQCTPTFRAFRTALFSDDACSNPANYAYATTPAICGEVELVESDGYYLPGKEVPGDAWTTFGGKCQSRAAVGFLRNLITIGSKIAAPLARFDSRNVGAERLAVPILSEGEVPLIAGKLAYVDNARQRNCEPRLVDGQLRCLPAGFDLREIAAELVRYADAKCTQPLIYCATGNCTNEVYYDAVVRDACTRAPRYAGMRRLLLQVKDNVYAKDETGTCVGPAAPSSVWTNELMNAADFALLERVTL